MEKEKILKEIVSQFIEFAPEFKRSFMTMSSIEPGMPKLTSLQYMAVLVLSNPTDAEHFTMNRLSSVLNISKQQATKLVDGLVEEKLVNRFTNPGNRREVLVELSLDGYECLEKIRQIKFAQLLAQLHDYSKEEMLVVLGHIKGINEVFVRHREQ